MKTNQTKNLQPPTTTGWVDEHQWGGCEHGSCRQPSSLAAVVHQIREASRCCCAAVEAPATMGPRSMCGFGLLPMCGLGVLPMCGLGLLSMCGLGCILCATYNIDKCRTMPTHAPHQSHTHAPFLPPLATTHTLSQPPLQSAGRTLPPLGAWFPYNLLPALLSQLESAGDVDTAQLVQQAVQTHIELVQHKSAMVPGVRGAVPRSGGGPPAMRIGGPDVIMVD